MVSILSMDNGSDKCGDYWRGQSVSQNYGTKGINLIREDLIEASEESG